MVSTGEKIFCEKQIGDYVTLMILAIDAEERHVYLLCDHRSKVTHSPQKKSRAIRFRSSNETLENFKLDTLKIVKYDMHNSVLNSTYEFEYFSKNDKDDFLEIINFAKE